MTEPRRADDDRPVRRSLILAGGGMKVGYQAGVMQVLLDEAGLSFDHADGTSGGCLNLAQLQSGLSGTRIANNWRNTGPFDLTSLQPVYRYLMPWRLPSMLTFDRLLRQLPVWGVDFGRIHGSPIAGTYNVFNFTDKAFETHPGTDLTPELFTACFALPIWFPAVETRQDLHRRRLLEGREPVRGGLPRCRRIWSSGRCRIARLPPGPYALLQHHRGDRRRPFSRTAQIEASTRRPRRHRYRAS
jgi:predicted acylesterase/phospholipase RssA